MAVIRKGLPNTKRGDWTKYDNQVFRIKGLTDGAKVLYGFLASLRSGDEFTDTFVMNGLHISQKTLTNRKRELKELGLILIEKTGLRGYVMYIGYVGFNAYLGQGEVFLDDEVLIGPFVSITASNHLRKDNSYRFGGYESKRIEIGKGTWIAAHVSITAGTSIGVGSLLAAGAVVTRSFEDNKLIAGIPAKIIKDLT